MPAPITLLPEVYRLPPLRAYLLRRLAVAALIYGALRLLEATGHARWALYGWTLALSALTLLTLVGLPAGLLALRSIQGVKMLVAEGRLAEAGERADGLLRRVRLFSLPLCSVLIPIRAGLFFEQEDRTTALMILMAAFESGWLHIAPPNPILAACHIARIWVAEGDRESASAWYATAEKLAAGGHRARLVPTEGLVLLRLGRAQEAATLLEHWLEAPPEPLTPWSVRLCIFLVAFAHEELGGTFELPIDPRPYALYAARWPELGAFIARQIARHEALSRSPVPAGSC